MSEKREGLRIRLPAEPENVSVLREAAVTKAEKVGMDAGWLADLKTVVTEACANVVLHAYVDQEQPGPIEARSNANEDAVGAVIRDFGRGCIRQSRGEAKVSDLASR